MITTDVETSSRSEYNRLKTFYKYIYVFTFLSHFVIAWHSSKRKAHRDFLSLLSHTKFSLGPLSRPFSPELYVFLLSKQTFQPRWIREIILNNTGTISKIWICSVFFEETVRPKLIMKLLQSWCFTNKLLTAKCFWHITVELSNLQLKYLEKFEAICEITFMGQSGPQGEFFGWAREKQVWNTAWRCPCSWKLMKPALLHMFKSFNESGLHAD
jgi:hypothetical protein